MNPFLFLLTLRVSDNSRNYYLTKIGPNEETTIMAKTKQPIGLKLLLGISMCLTIFLIIGQTYSLVNYSQTVSVGLQESSDEIGLLGIAWAKAFALGDSISYIPLLLIGIVGLINRKRWGTMAMIASLSISVYWPIVNLSAIYLGRSEINLSSDKYLSYSILLPLISLYGLWGMWYLYKNQKLIEK